MRLTSLKLNSEKHNSQTMSCTNNGRPSVYQQWYAYHRWKSTDFSRPK